MVKMCSIMLNSYGVITFESLLSSINYLLPSTDCLCGLEASSWGLGSGFEKNDCIRLDILVEWPGLFLSLRVMVMPRLGGGVYC